MWVKTVVWKVRRVVTMYVDDSWLLPWAIMKERKTPWRTLVLAHNCSHMSPVLLALKGRRTKYRKTWDLFCVVHYQIPVFRRPSRSVGICWKNWKIGSHSVLSRCFLTTCMPGDGSGNSKVKSFQFLSYTKLIKLSWTVFTSKKIHVLQNLRM